jgi:acetoacetyl-CoA synthetase
VESDLWLQSVSGGTDVCTAFLGGVPGAPVRAGELQGRALGAAVEAWDADGRPVVDEVGELVVTAPMPSMPLRFWNDPGGARYRESYFDAWPGVWRHGDWIRITPEGGAVIHGRSDATLNRHGVRLGSSEIYAVVEALPEVAEALAVDVELPGRSAWMGLFVALAPGATLDAALEARIRATLRRELSPRHVPDAIVAVAAIPRTLNGKKLEVPVKRVLLGAAPERVATAGSLADPAALAAFTAIGERLRRGEL